MWKKIQTEGSTAYMYFDFEGRFICEKATAIKELV
jgi:hypothetical protein